MRRLLGLLLSSMLVLGTVVPSSALMANEVISEEPKTEIIQDTNESEESEELEETEKVVEEKNEGADRALEENIEEDDESTPGSGDEKTVQILATSDLHNHFYPHQYATNEPYAKGSLPRVANYVKEVRTPDTILIDNGDTIQDNNSALFMDDEVLPMIKGMNAIGYDYFSAGNHEFNYGVPKLEEVIETFNGQFLLSNVYRGSIDEANRLEGKTKVAKNYDIKELPNGIRVATIGAVTPNITKWDGDNLKGFVVTDPKDEVEKALDAIGDDADVIVVAFHAGLNEEYPGMTDSAREIAEAFSGKIDVIIAGHAHALINEEVSGVRIVEPSSLGQHVSNIQLTVDPTKAAGEKVTKIVAKNVAMAGREVDAGLMELLKEDDKRARDDMATEIGALEGGPLIEANEIKGIPQGQVEDSALIDLILKVQMEHVEKYYEDMPKDAKHVSAAALFSLDANVQPGILKKHDAAKIYKFDNELRTIKTTGKDLKQYMEWSSNYFNTQEYGDLTVSFDENVASFLYDMFGGVDYEINIAKPKGSRIEKLVYSADKTPVADEDVIYLTVNDYRANAQLMGNDNIIQTKELVYSTANTDLSNVREMVVEYIMSQPEGIIHPDKDNNWKITGTNWNAMKREMLVKYVSSGDLEVPTSGNGRNPNVRSLGWKDVESLSGVTSISLSSVNDIHGAVSASSSNPGVAKFGGAVKRFKDYHENAHFFGSGDLYQGTAISNLTEGKVMSEVFAELEMEYSAVGNHEFDWGVDKMPGFATDGGFKFLAANIIEKDTGKVPNWAQPTAMLETGGKKIGLIGLSPESTKYQTAAENVANLEFLEPIAVTKKLEKELRAAGADAVIVLSHLGSVQKSTPGYEDEGSELAEAIPTLDGVFTAHYHHTVNKRVGNVPVVQGSYNGRALSQLTLVFDANGKVQTIGEVEDLRSQIPTLPVDAKIAEIVEKYEEDLKPTLGKKVADGKYEYHHDASKLDDPVTPMGQLTAKIMTDIGNTDIAVINGGGIRRGLDQGEITMGDMYEIFPFDNTLVTLKMKGKDIKDIIEHGMPPVNYKAGQFYGVDVDYYRDEDGKPHIFEMRLLDGTPMDMEKEYTVSTLDFLIGGGDEYDFSKGTDVVDTMTPLRNQIVNWMEDQETVDYVFAKNIFLKDKPIDPEPIKDVFKLKVKEVSYPFNAKVTEAQFFKDLGLTSVAGAKISSNFDSVVKFNQSGDYKVTITGTVVTRHTRAVQTTTEEVLLIVKPNKDGKKDDKKDGSLVATGQPIFEQLIIGASMLSVSAFALRKRKK